MKIEKAMGFILGFLLLIAVFEPLFSQERPSQIGTPHKMLGLSFEGFRNMRGFQQFPGTPELQKLQPQLNLWKISPPVINWKAASRWRSIQEIYILKHRVYNELIQNKKRLNLA